MRYVSTRGRAPAIGFGEMLLAGPAPDGGLYVPEQWPLQHEDQLRSLASAPYGEVAARIIGYFTGDAFAPDELRADIDAAYAAFSHKAVAPLTEIAPNLFLLELFHGPTLAFKDVAMQLLGRLFARELKERGGRATIVVATSGDTGAAAIAAFRGAPNVQIVVLHPRARISEVQRRQMTTVLDANVHNLALEGSFDDAQALVKALFADAAFALSAHLAAVNSINFARIAAQCVYYFTAAAVLGASATRPITFAVPTGNFGDAFSGEVAWRMGVPTERLIVATNANNVLARVLDTGRFEKGPVQATLSPAMDIQLASNFERALFTASGRNENWLAEAMRGFAASGRLDIIPDVLASLRKRYTAGHVNDEETLAAMARVYREAEILIDPHTAVALAVAAKTAKASSGPVVVLSTAHPAKFPEAVARATGVTPALPPQLADLFSRPERYDIVPNDLHALKTTIMERIRAA